MSGNFVKRIVSALFIGPFFIFSILFAPYFFQCIIIVVGCLMFYEWYGITKSSFIDTAIGFLSISCSIFSIYFIYYLGYKYLILGYFFLVWSVDSFAMLGGKFMGGRKLVPRISPSKTYSGLFSGITAGAVVSTLFDILLDIKKVGGYHNYEHVFLCSFFMGLLAQFSDLYVSYFKRKFKVKDSGTLIPGHGGFLDRFDSLILTAPILFLFI